MASICVLALRTGDRLDACLASIRATVEPTKAEIIVVGNAMSPATASALGRRLDVTVLASEANLGFGGGNNAAARTARGDYLVFLNDDSTVEPGWLDHLVRTAETDPAIGAVGCRIADPGGTLQEAGSVLWQNGLATHVGQGLAASSPRYRYVREVDYASANGMLVRREAFAAVGGFDDRYHPAYFEDVDLCLSLRSAGYRVVFEPRARIRHATSQSSTDPFRRFLFNRNRLQLVDKWGEVLADHSLMGGVKEDAVARAVQRARGNPPLVLVVLGDPGVEGAPDGLVGALPAVGELTAAGAAVTVLLPQRPDRPESRSAGGPESEAATMDQLVDLGVEVAHGTLSAFLADSPVGYEVAVVPGPHLGAQARELTTGHRPALVLEFGDGWLDQARQHVAQTGARPAVRTDRSRTGPDSKPKEAGADADAPARSTTEVGTLTGTGTGVDTEVGAASVGVRAGPSSVPIPLQLEYALAEAAVTDEYIAKLEADVARMTGEVERLPTTRLKRLLQRAIGPERWRSVARRGR